MSQALEDEFGDIIKKSRRGMGYSPEDVQRLTGINGSSLAALESYRRDPTPAEVKKLAEVFRLNADKLAEIADRTWSPEPDPWLAEQAAIVKVIPVDVGGYVENCYVVACTSTHRAIIVDPGGSPNAIQETIAADGL